MVYHTALEGLFQFGSGLNYLWNGKIVRERNTETICDQGEHHLTCLFEGEKYQNSQCSDLQTAVSAQAQAHLALAGEMRTLVVPWFSTFQEKMDI